MMGWGGGGFGQDRETFRKQSQKYRMIVCYWGESKGRVKGDSCVSLGGDGREVLGMGNMVRRPV